MREHQNPPKPEARSTKTRKDENSGVILHNPLITARAAKTQEMIKAGLLILMAFLGAKMIATARVTKHKIPENRLVLAPWTKAICGCKKASCMEVRAKKPQVIFSPRLITTAFPLGGMAFACRVCPKSCIINAISTKSVETFKNTRLL